MDVLKEANFQLIRRSPQKRLEFKQNACSFGVTILHPLSVEIVNVVVDKCL